MQLRMPSVSVRFSALIGLPIALVCAFFVNPVELRAEEPGGPSAAEPPTPLAMALGVRFVDGSSSSLILERDGKEYVVDLATQTIRENSSPVQVASAESQQVSTPSTAAANSGASIFRQQCASCHGADGKGAPGQNTPDLTNFRARSGIPSQTIIDVVTNGKSGTAMQGFSGRLSAAEIRDVTAFVQSLATPAQSNVYEPADDLVFSLPTGRRLPKGGLYINFTHRFAYDPAFSGPGLGNILFGLDGFSVSSFGLRYGITDKFSVNVYRSPSAINRPIEFMGAYNFLDEHDGHPINAAFRVSIDGQDNFRRNFTTNFEAVVSRSITNRAQLYVVPTYSFNNRRLVSASGALSDRPPEQPGFDSFSIGAGLAWNFRPTVALVTEVIPTLMNGDDLGIHRPAYSFGVQKQVRGHAFTIGFTQGPGTTVAQRAGTRATLLNNPSADKPSGLFFAFNLMRRLR
jgi:mono/diheme cytochrome c family protein